jgi:hypothetical protein
MKPISFLLAAALTGACLGCQKKPAPEPRNQPASKSPDVEPMYHGEPQHRNESKPTMVLRISVLLNGDVLEDGQKVTIDQLAASLARVKVANGGVWYYREAANQEPPPVAMQVFKLVMENRLPITLSTKPDFSNYIDDMGQAHNR